MDEYSLREVVLDGGRKSQYEVIRNLSGGPYLVATFNGAGYASDYARLLNAAYRRQVAVAEIKGADAVISDVLGFKVTSE